MHCVIALVKIIDNLLILSACCFIMLVIQDLSVSLLYTLYPALQPNVTKDHVINGNNLKKALEKVQ